MRNLRGHQEKWVGSGETNGGKRKMKDNRNKIVIPGTGCQYITLSVCTEER